QGPDNYILAKSLPVECGINRVMLRSTLNSGKIVLSAAANGLRSARVEIPSRPFASSNGLSLEMPDAGLSENLTRGVTPPGMPLKMSRRAVQIVKTSAGANASKAALSFDD